MKIKTAVLGLIALLAMYNVPAHGQDEVLINTEALKRLVQQFKDEMNTMKNTVRDLARQTMLQQFAVEERVRSEGNSGVKLVRGTGKGPENYYEATHISGSFNSIHDHSNYDRTIGMGEIIAVLNGVEFRTRHNDYKLKMASTTSTDYHDTEPVPFPEVPKAVTDLNNVDDQITEMREWFKAFLEQNSTVRDYRPYFRPVLCYLEGAWTLDKELDEPFESDRHQIDASSWFELQNLVRYASYTGTKSRLENFAYLPTTIMSVNETTGLPNYAQWNYRILCSPIDQDVPLSYLKPVDDMAHRLSKGKTLSEVKKSRGQRFNFYEFDEPRNLKDSLIDKIFYTIPGKDNIPGPLNQSSFGEDMFTMDGSPLNTGYYHRFFKFSKPGAMGLSTVARGYNDANCWVAQSTQKRVAPIGLKNCKRVRVEINGRMRRRTVCEMYYTRFSYAIPLEVIYMTPLLSWNPFNLTVHPNGKGATEGGRDGRNNPYNGVDSGHYYMTPVEFFRGRVDNSDKADTVRNAVKVMDQTGEVRKTTASGTRIFLPEIEGVGSVRLRYPIAPVHGEGSSVWKELNAVKSLVKSGENQERTAVHFEMSPTLRDPPGEHTHEFVVSMDTYNSMMATGEEVTVTTTENQGHTHTLKVKYFARQKQFAYINCGSGSTCWDGHPKELTELNPSTETGPGQKPTNRQQRQRNRAARNRKRKITANSRGQTGLRG